MGITVALAGNPNSGKTTMYNLLTGSSQYVGNWPGVTVEKKAAKYKKNKDVQIVDLPGIYSLSPYTLEEVVSRDFLLNEKPDAILNMVDASNIERNLYLTTQLLELGIPVVVALNMMDIVKKRGDTIDIQSLEKYLGCKVVEVSALKNTGIDNLMKEVMQISKSKKGQEVAYKFSKQIEDVISKIQSLPSLKNSDNSRWQAIKLFERDERFLKDFSITPDDEKKLHTITENIEQALDDDSESIITNERYSAITGIISDCVSKVVVHSSITDKIDSIVTNRILALPIFIGVMWLVYYLSVSTVGTMASDYVNETIFGEDGLPSIVTGFLESMNVSEILIGLIVDGIIVGVGAVLGFLPLIIVLYICLGILEDIGYMSRVAFIMDRIFRRFGLSGKSFIPFLIATGCSIPGVMGTRTIENDKDRRMSIMITSFMPCGAKAPIIALIAASAFGGASWVGPLTYVIAIFAIIVSGVVLKKTRLFSGDPAPFVMELPAYHIPSFKNVSLKVWERAKSFATKAGTIILASSIVLWLLMNFTTSFEYIAFADDSSESILAVLGGAIAPIFSPLGFGSWMASVATITGLIAKEMVVSTMGIVSGLGEIDPEAASENAQFVAVASQMFTHGSIGAFSFMMFNLFCIPCFAAVGAMRREMNDSKWFAIALAYQMIFAYSIAFITYQLGIVLIAGESVTIGTILAGLLLAVWLYMLFRSSKEKKSDAMPLSTLQKVG